MFAFKDVNRRRQTPAHVVHQGECVMRSGPEHERTGTNCSARWMRECAGCRDRRVAGQVLFTCARPELE